MAQRDIGREFKPLGQPRISLQSDILKSSLREEYIQAICHWIQKTKEDAARELQENQNLSMLDAAILSCLLHCIKHGDYAKLDSIIGRVIGKQAETITVQTSHASIVDLIYKHQTGAKDDIDKSTIQTPEMERYSDPSVSN